MVHSRTLPQAAGCTELNILHNSYISALPLMAQWDSQQCHLNTAWKYKRNRVHLNNSTKHESEIAGKSIVPLVEKQRNLKYIQLGAACGNI